MNLNKKFIVVVLLCSPLLAAETPGHQVGQGAHGQSGPSGQLSTEAMISLALRHQREGRPTEAMRTLRQAIDQEPRDADLRAVRASLYLEYNQIAKALEDLELAHQVRPDDARILTNRAQAYRAVGRFAEAKADLDRALELEPDLIPARLNRGTLLHAEGRLEAALADFEHCVAVEPHAPAPYFNRAATYRAMGRNVEALADLRRFVDLSKNPRWKQAGEQLLMKWQTEDLDKGPESDERRP